MEHEGDGETICGWWTWNNSQRIGTETGGLGKKRTSSDHSNYSIIKIGQNTEKSPGNVRRLAVTPTPMSGFTIPAECKMKMKGKKNIDKYFDLVWEPKRLWNMKVTVIPLVVRALGTVSRSLGKKLEWLEIREKIETLQATKSTQIMRRMLKTWRDLLSLRLPWKITSLLWCEKLNLIIRKCSKQKYKSWYVWVGKVIHWKLCKRLKFDHTSKWYLHYPESAMENEIYKILWDCEMQTDHVILARRPDLEIIREKMTTYRIVDFAVPTEHRVKIKENEKRNKYLDLARELKKLCDGGTNCKWCTRNDHKKHGKGTERFGNRSTQTIQIPYC